MRISDWSSDVCSSDLPARLVQPCDECFLQRRKQLDDNRVIPPGRANGTAHRDIGKLTCKSYGLQAAHIAQIAPRGLKHAKPAVNLSHTAQAQTIILRFSGDGSTAQACLLHYFVDAPPQLIAPPTPDPRLFDNLHVL